MYNIAAVSESGLCSKYVQIDNVTMVTDSRTGAYIYVKNNRAVFVFKKETLSLNCKTFSLCPVKLRGQELNSVLLSVSVVLV